MGFFILTFVLLFRPCQVFSLDWLGQPIQNFSSNSKLGHVPRSFIMCILIKATIKCYIECSMYVN